MIKYIDAEKLKTEIKRYKNKADSRLKMKGRTFSEEQKDLAIQNLCGNLLHFIDSLTQEQPDFPTTDEQMKEFLATHPKIKVPEKYKNPDWLLNKQEQPNVDLETYIENVVNHYGLSLYEASYKTFSACDIDRIIRNAFELGINSRKEE